MTRRALVTVSVLAGSLLLTSSAPAAQIDVDVVGSPSDEAPPVANGNCTLREAVDAARLNTAVDGCAAGQSAAVDRITIPVGLVELAGAAGTDDNSSGDLDLNGGGPLEIAGDGAGSTEIQAATGDRAFDLLSGAVTISGINGYGGNPTGEGGFIRVAGGASLSLAGSSLHDNTAAGANGRGGAIDGALGSTISVDASAIESNTAEAANAGPAGGGIYSDGSLTVTDADVNANQATGSNVGSNGGGIAAVGSSASITDSTISGNTGVASGGGILFGRGVQSVTYELADSTVEGNTAPRGGGGVYLVGPNSLTVDRSTIHNNHVTGSSAGGAGINAAQNNSTDSLTISHSSITGNDITGTESSAGFMGGAAIRTTQGELHIRDSLIAHNAVTTTTATVIGGAIRTLTGTLTIENSTVFDNDLLTTSANSAGGALGLYLPNETTASDGTATIVHSTFSQNTVTGSGTDVYADDNGSVELHGSVLEGDCESTAPNPAISAASSFSVLGSTTCNAGTNNTTLTPGTLGLAVADGENGGPTATVALLPGSAALDFVPKNHCKQADGDPLDVDQRGVPRPADAACEAGAYERSNCRGTLVNLVGGNGADALTGTATPDGALGLDGKDVLKGMDGDDGLCGGKGKDKLVGGADHDICDGGKGHDKAKGCEVRKGVP